MPAPYVASGSSNSSSYPSTVPLGYYCPLTGQPRVGPTNQWEENRAGGLLRRSPAAHDPRFSKTPSARRAHAGHNRCVAWLARSISNSDLAPTRRTSSQRRPWRTEGLRAVCPRFSISPRRQRPSTSSSVARLLASFERYLWPLRQLTTLIAFVWTLQYTSQVRIGILIP